jgi:phosphoenolpyruvate carboxykinase (ATP)
MSKFDYLSPFNPNKIYDNLTPDELVEHSLKRQQGVLSDSGALCILTGRFTGRAPKDRYIVKDAITENRVDWGRVNKAFSPANFNMLEKEILEYFEDKEAYIQDAFACADESYRLKVRVVAEKPWSAQFITNMFIRPNSLEKANFSPDWHILCAPGYEADPEVHGTRSKNFAIINFTKQRIIIGGTGYTGEMKKGIFSVLNFILPIEKNVLSMHCSANLGADGDTAIFFGLSGTGKTTLSADANRLLIGDDEHGWSHDGVFNFEGGCYAKCIDLSEEKEPEIFRAIRHGAILENIIFKEGTRTPDFSDDSITQNTRVSYPIHHIDNLAPGCKGGHPKNIFFLTCDAFGVLPPISRLTKEQAMYHFISGYTAKVAGTEDGVKEPQATFSSCFGAPFLPLHPTKYAEMLGDKISKYGSKVWLVNTGWTGGPYGTGSRINLKYTRAMIRAAMKGHLDNVQYVNHDIFGISMPTTCDGVPDQVLNPKSTWDSSAAYDEKADHLAHLFIDNFERFENEASEAILGAAPVRLNLLA